MAIHSSGLPLGGEGARRADEVESNLRQHRTIMSARFGGSFPPIRRFEKFEIHTVFLRFSNLDLTKNLSPNLLAKLCGAALKQSVDHIL